MPPLPTKPPGKNGPQVPRLGFGTMGLSAWAGPTHTDEERFKVLDRAYELGETFWDTADLYPSPGSDSGDSEELLGKWFKRTGKRSEIFLATKFAGKMGQGMHDFQVRGDPEYVKETCEESLKKLGVDHIDLYYCHRVDGKTPIEHTVQAMAELKAYRRQNLAHRPLRDLARHVAARAADPPDRRRAGRVQSLHARDRVGPDAAARDVPRARRRRGRLLTIVARLPERRLHLGGRLQGGGDVRAHFPRFSPANFPQNLALVAQLQRLAAGKGPGVTSAQLSFAWLMAQGDDIFPIPGTRKIKYLDENVGSLAMKLTSEEEATIRTAIDAAEVHGDRYPEAMAYGLFADTPSL